MKDLSVKIAKIIVFLLLLAIFPWPYFYYSFLRSAIFVSGIFLIDQLFKKKKNDYLLIVAFIVLLFNPIFPIYLSKQLWILIDLIVAFFYFKLAQNYERN